jgi:hypothetical protein
MNSAEVTVLLPRATEGDQAGSMEERENDLLSSQLIARTGLDGVWTDPL